MNGQQAPELGAVPAARSSTRGPAGSKSWLWCLGLGCLCAVVFVVSDQPWVQAGVQVSVYALSAALLTWRWWRTRKIDPDPLLALAVFAFGLYFCASILGALLPLITRPTTAAGVPSPLDGLFLLSYSMLGFFLWRLGNRSAGAGRRDVLDMLIVIVGVGPLFWVFLIAPLFGSGAPLPALLTYLAYPVSVFGLVCLTIRLAFVARRRTVVHVLMGGWIVGELTADLVFLNISVGDAYAYGQEWQALWILSAACIGSLALHPRSDVLLERHTRRQVNGPRRLWVLAGCMVTPILTIVYGEAFTAQHVGVLFAGICSFFLVFLLCLRLSGLMVDNAAQLRVQERLRELTDGLAHQAMHDPLTGLGNRLLFADHADHALAQRTDVPDRATALLLLDLDDFKMVNDSFGHEAGDQVLVEVARRLRQVTRQGEAIFRLGGDEFAFVLAQARLEDALHLADRINAVLSEPFDLGPRQVRPVASIGVSIALDGQGRSTLLAQADLAMYAGKDRRTGSASVFDPVLHQESLERHQLERDLRDAVARHEIRVLYQPLVHLPTREIVGVEALLRWQHPTRGVISPAEFIPLAETNGAIIQLGDWVLQESLFQLRAWDGSGGTRRLRISVNISPRQLSDPRFVLRAADMLRTSGLDPARVTLEVTEAAFGADSDAMIERLHELKHLGVNLAIDDFGTEYSALSKLRRIPVDILKIDKSFVDGIATDPSERALAAAIVNLAASLGKSTVAEGVETEGQLAELLHLDVELGQGYLFARPLSAGAITDLLALATAFPSTKRAEEAEVRDEPLVVPRDPRFSDPATQGIGGALALSGIAGGLALRPVAPGERNAPVPIGVDESSPSARMLRGLLRIRSTEQAARLLQDAAVALGGSLTSTDEAGVDALPLDLSLGEGPPVLVEAGSSVARLRLERFLPRLVEDARQAVDLLRHHERLEDVSNTDQLTGLGNRRVLDRVLRHSFDGVHILIDLDHFKQVNDTAGHQAGDEVLAHFGRLLSREVRSGDTCCRLGGEEFVVLTPGGTVVDAVDLVDRLRSVWTEVAPLPVTFSAGVAAIDGAGGAAALAAADRALYRAKALGRDRTEVELAPASGE